jgi:acyl-CoA thioester hydrolase
MLRAEFTMGYPLRVRWAEIDRQGVVFNAHYFLYFDVAVAEYWRAIGFDYPAALEPLGSDVFAVKASAKFHGSARYDEMLELVCRCGRIGRSSLQFILGVYRGEEHLTTGELLYVHVDLATRRSSAVPDALRQAILAYEKTPPLC